MTSTVQLPSNQHIMYILSDTMTRINEYNQENSPESDSDDGEFDDE